MIEAPEARILCRQLNETVRGKKITDVYTQFSPHKFAWFTGSSEEYAEQLSGKTIDHAQSQGGMVEITIGDKVLILTDGVNLRYLAPGSKLPAKHQLLIAFEDESCLVASVRMYGGLMCYDKDAADGVLSNYYLTARSKPPGHVRRFQPGIFPRTYQCRQRTEEIRQSFPCHRTDDSRTRQRCFAGYPLPYTYPPEEKNKRTDRQRARKFVLSDKRDDE